MNADQPHARDRLRLPPDWLGMFGVAATAGLHYVLQADGPNPAFMAGACLFWVAFAAWRIGRNRHVVREWGFRLDNLAAAAKVPAILLVVCVAAMAAFGAMQGNLAVAKNAPLLWMAYPVWGVVQQFLALAIVVNGLEGLPCLSRSRARLAIVAAIVFGAVHAYDWRLAVATSLFEGIAVLLYTHRRNLLPLGVLHGWAGALFYAWVLGRDLWSEALGG